MGVMEQFWKWLTATTSRVPQKGHPDLYPLDVAKLTKEINLVEEAKRLGEAGLPASDATALAGVEALIVQRVEKVRQDYTDWAVLRMQVLSQDLAKRNITHVVNRARQADMELERRAGAILADKENQLQGLSETAAKRKSELGHFKTTNGLTRDAHPPFLGAFLRYSLLALAVLVEGIVNANFFAQGLSTGLIGGFGYAASLAFLNVLAAFFIGKVFVRNIYHRNHLQKSLGALSVAGAIVFMLLIGLVIAHMRDALTAEAVDASRTALETLLATPLSLRDVFSWALLGISIIFASLALLDGLLSDDLYPGYGSISRRAQLAADDYDYELTGLRSELAELKDEQLEALDKEVGESQSSVAVFESLINDKRAASSRLSHALLDADYALEALLRKFRTENELSRAGKQRPVYFDSRPTLRPLPLPDFDTSADEKALAEQRVLVNALLAELQTVRASIQESFTRHFDRLKPLDTLFPSQDGT